MKLNIICFSPTGGTSKAAEILAGNLNSCSATEFTDLTDRKKDFGSIGFTKDDTVIIAVPSYSGRVPQPAAERISAIHGNGAKAILMCIYGNRAYDDTLAELLDTARLAGFRTVAAVAAIAEHSIARRYAAGRPDATDRLHLAEIARKIVQKIERNDDSEPSVPGNRPYRKAGKTGFVPKPTKQCVNCGICAQKCPTGAIDMTDQAKVDKNACISCMRCVSVCPYNARKVSGLMLAAAEMMLKKACSDRKDCELFI